MNSTISWSNTHGTSDEEALLQRKIAEHDAAASVDAEAYAPPAETAIDPAVERDAYVALIAHLNSADDGDTDTVVTMIGADEFEADTFTLNRDENSQ